MATGSPFHTERGRVYHDHTNCSIAVHIPEQQRIAGTAGLPLCKECANLQPRTAPPKRAKAG